MKRIKNRKLGFTLLELLVVVLIIGILAGIALPQYQKTVWKARFAEVYTVTNALEKGIESYMLTHNIPTSGDWIDISSEELDIDVLSNLTEKEYSLRQLYCSKYVCYSIGYMDGEISWRADMYKNTNDNLGYDSGNAIAEMKGTKGSSGWYRSCWYEGETADMGKYLCESTNWDDVDEGF